MEIRVLGSVEIAVADRTALIPGSAERELLALLAVSAGRIVPVSALVDALWPGQLPTNPANALQMRVSKLRRALHALGLPQGLVVTRAPGYLINLDPLRVDALCFDHLVAAARAAVDTDPPTAIRLYRQGLSLWRGRPFADFPTARWAEVEATRLSEVALAAREELADLELAAGRHAEVLPELEALTAAHPLRERLHGRLMLALYRSGRQADALAVYQRLRTRLDGELGLEPDVDLRDLQKAILEHRSGLRAPDRPAPVRPTAAPSVQALPPRLTAFLGREEDLRQVDRLVRTHRLVTVTGPGGVGKTSLALEAARGAAGHFAHGVGLVRLSGLTDPGQVPHAVLAALGVQDVATAAEDQLLGHLQVRQVLLVLDNCEHLADACAVLAERLLESCPDVRLLATSREPLAARGEVQCALDPLPVPAPDADRAALPASTAVQLFADRARAVLPAFRLDGDTLSAVAEICRRLDGIPLALELAAARVAAIPATELAGRMTDRFALLTSGPRTAEARQRTLRATVDWSYDLLTDPERTLLRRLSVFRNGWTLEAVEAVACGAGLDPAAIIDVLAHLVDRSLVVVDHDVGPRYRLLETIRQYAEDRLAETAEFERISRAHVRYLTHLAERAERGLRGPDQPRWLRRLSLERDDIDAALVWCTAHAAADPDGGLRLVGALGWYWYFASRPDGGRRIAAMLTAAPNGSAGARARALQALAVAARPGSCIVHPAPDCAAAAAESRTLYVALGDDFRTALSTTLLAVEAIRDDPSAAFDALAETERVFTRTGDTWCAALVQFVRMELHAARGDWAAASAGGDRALATFRAIGDQWGISAVQFHLGVALHRAGRLDQALAMYEGALSTGRAAGPVNTVQYALAGAGHVSLLLDDPDRAGRLFAESHAVARQLGAEGNPRALIGEGLLAREVGDLTRARHLLTRALDMLAGRDEPEWEAAALVALGHVIELDGDLGGARSAHQRAWETAPGKAIAALEGLACVAAARGDAADAARLLGAAAGWRRRLRHPLTRLERVDAERAERRARALLGEAAFEAAHRTGVMDPHTVADVHGGPPGPGQYLGRPPQCHESRSATSP